MTSTRSVDVSLARRFNAGKQVTASPRRVATMEFAHGSGVTTRREHFRWPYPALKRPG